MEGLYNQKVLVVGGDIGRGTLRLGLLQFNPDYISEVA